MLVIPELETVFLYQALPYSWMISLLFFFNSFDHLQLFIQDKFMFFLETYEYVIWPSYSYFGSPNK